MLIIIKEATMNNKIGIVQINDTHANILPHGDVRYGRSGFEIENMGGYPRLMTKIKEYKNNNPHGVLVFDNGDTFHGTYEAVESKGEVIIPYVKAMGIDAMTFHWDSAYTLDRLKEIGEKLEYPILAANVYFENKDELIFQPTKIFEVKGIKIGVIGIASNIIKKNMPKPFWEGGEFTNGIEETKKWVKSLKSDGVDLIILLSHLGYPQDIELLKNVEGIDICLSGHTHNRIRFVEKVGETYIIQSGSLASSMGFLEFEMENGKIANLHHEYVVLDDSIKEDGEILEMIDSDSILEKHKDYLDVEVGESLIHLHRGSSFYGTMDYLLLDSIRDATDLDIAFSNGWRYGGAIKKGTITRRNLYQIVPMDPPIMTAEMTGKEIWDMLEENLEKTFSSEPFNQMGGYIKRSSGLKIFWKLENPYGHRIQRIFVGDNELDLGKVYKVAYVTRQGVPETFGKNHKEFRVNSIEAMEKLLKKGAYDRKDLESYIPV